MDSFEIDQGVQFYQGIIEADQHTVTWTDGKQTQHSLSELKAMLYNPIAAVYN